MSNPHVSAFGMLLRHMFKYLRQFPQLLAISGPVASALQVEKLKN